MDDHRKKPGSPGDILDEKLEHHGVKGMKWGIRDSEEGGDSSSQIVKAKLAAGTNASKKAFMQANEKQIRETAAKTPKQVEKNLDANLAKFSAKFHDSPSGKTTLSKTVTKSASPKQVVDAKKSGGGLKAKWKKLSPDQKALIIEAGIGTAVVGGLLIAGHRNRQAILAMGGKAISLEAFTKNVDHSQYKTWGSSGYVQKASWAREAFELPAGHTFHRLTTSAETGFRDATYSTHSIEDFDRYVAQFRQELGPKDINHVKFTTNSPTKVPALHEVLGTLQKVLAEDANGGPATPADTLSRYKSMSGGSWSGPHSVKLMDELKKKGYGALVDEMDAGVIGETPLVFFNKESANPKVVKSLSKADIDHAESKLVELLNRKV